MIEIHPICEMFKYSHSILNSTYQGIFKTVLTFIPGACVVNDKYWLKKVLKQFIGLALRLD